MEDAEEHGDGEYRSRAAERVLEAASELFYRDGIRATGVEAIVERSGVTKMTLYKHFGSKDELVAAYLRRRDGRWRKWLSEAVERRVGKDDCAKERILAVFDALGSWLGGEVEGFRGCAFINAATEISDPDHPAREVVREQKRWMGEYLRELASEAGVCEPEVVAEQLLILFEGATITTVMDSGHNPTQKARAVARALLDDL